MSEQAPLLDVVLRPAPPLSPRILLIILAIVATINAIFAASFMLHGAWPMMPFMGADIALLAWAFRASERAAKREEHVVLTPSLLKIARWPPKGAPSEFTFNPYWVRVEMADAARAWQPAYAVESRKESQTGQFPAAAGTCLLRRTTEIRAARRSRGSCLTPQDSGGKATRPAPYSAHERDHFHHRRRAGLEAHGTRDPVLVGTLSRTAAP